MLDPDQLVDSITALIQTNTALLALISSLPASVLPPSTKYPTPASRVLAFHAMDPGGVNVEQAIQEQDRGTVMVCWIRTYTGAFARLEATKHDFSLYVKPAGRAGPWVQALVDGPCTNDWDGTTNRFRWSQPVPQLNPPDKTESSPQPTLIAQQFVIYDIVPVNLTYTERGVDNYL